VVVVASFQGCGNKLHMDTNCKTKPKIGTKGHAKNAFKTLVAFVYGRYTWINGD